MNDARILQGDCLETLKTLDAGSVQTCVTSPPYYGLRDYGHDGQIGLESTPDEYVAKLVEVFRQVRRVLRDDGTVFLNLGDSYYGSGKGVMGDGSIVGGPKQRTNQGTMRGTLTPTRGGGQRAVSYGTSGKAPGDYQDRDCLCGNLCDVCRVVYQSHKSRNDGLLVAMLTASLSAPNQGHTESGRDHLPTSDSVHQGSRNARAIQGQPQIVRPADERLRAVLVSTIGESFPQLLDVCLQRGAACVCLLCARSLADCVQVYAHTSNDLLGLDGHIQDNGLRGDQQMRRNQCTDKVCGCCNGIESYPYYTTAYHSGQLKPKDLIGIPWLVAFALRADGWYLRSDIIWHKPNPMPESVTDRPTKAHEYIFLLSKSREYYYDNAAIMEPNAGDLPYGDKRNFKMNDDAAQGRHGKSSMFAGGSRQEYIEKYYTNGRNRRSVWTVATQPYEGAHFATYPVKLIEPCILAGTSAHGCCAKCGAPWVREVERERLPINELPEDHPAYRKNNASRYAGVSMRNDAADGRMVVTSTSTTGWQPTCTCNADVVPCTVLDPFSGSGTTGAVALKHGRRYIGCELNPEYIELAYTRIGQSQPMLLEVQP